MVQDPRICEDWLTYETDVSECVLTKLFFILQKIYLDLFVVSLV